jgi:riboflavin-specific deaminase-like protein
VTVDNEDSELERAWRLVRTLRARASGGVPPNPPRELATLDSASSELLVSSEVTPMTRQMLELCLPVCLARAGRPFVYAHLGQSLDGMIATASGASRYVTSAENLLHMHRLRALADAVLVGAGTIASDDPQLTTRLVEGANPARVVIDPGRRLSADRRVFQDGCARTLLVCRAGTQAPRGFDADVEVVEIHTHTAELPPSSIVAALAERGLRHLFVEGGGVTVSRFLDARVLDRLHVTVCPIFIGRGRPGVVLPAVERMDQALRPSARRFLLGEDVLFDCAFERARVRPNES